MKLLGSIEKRIVKDKNGENVPQSEITEVVLLIHSSLVNNIYKQDHGVLVDLSPPIEPPPLIGPPQHFQTTRLSSIPSFGQSSLKGKVCLPKKQEQSNNGPPLKN